jgi:L-fuconolactonase
MIDSHHHLWRYSAAEYPWIPAESALARDHLLPELEAVTTAAGVTGTVVVQARQVIEESDFLLELADRSERILCVVGWVPLVDPGVGRELDRLAAHLAFKGVRHVLQEEPDDYFLRDDFHRGLAMLPGHHLSYDLLVFQRQLPLALALADRHPDLRIIIDHIAKPEAVNGRIETAWQRGMRELAMRGNIIGVKFSGLLTEFPEGPVEPESIAAYFEETLEIFGADRVMFGTDWPVCLLRTSYQEWAETVIHLTAGLSTDERAAIHTRNAIRCYRLDAKPVP